MVVGQERVLHAPSDVRLKVRKVKVAGRRCRVGAATPLSVLVATRLRLGAARLRPLRPPPARRGRAVRDEGA